MKIVFLAHFAIISVKFVIISLDYANAIGRSLIILLPQFI